MRDTELYRHLLGVEQPWTVSRVELSVEQQRVDVWAEHGKDARFRCPTCGKPSGLCDHAAERSWNASRQLSVSNLLASASAVREV
jgi:hypothetical protein